ncbi:MAG: hypothetical protein J5I98_20775 [Phaeodactylibacter sp.]|nr:hypothetical protein [Phaeodactylibacter sp.]
MVEELKSLNKRLKLISLPLFVMATIMLFQYLKISPTMIINVIFEDENYVSGVDAELHEEFIVTSKEYMVNFFSKNKVVNEETSDSLRIIRGLRKPGYYFPFQYRKYQNEGYFKINKDEYVYTLFDLNEPDIKRLTLTKADKLNYITAKAKISYPLNVFQKIRFIGKDSITHSQWLDEKAEVILLAKKVRETTDNKNTFHNSSVFFDTLYFIPGNYVKEIIPASTDTLYSKAENFLNIL